MILILGSQEDEHAVHVLQQVRHLQHEAELLDSRWFPEHVQLSAEFRDGKVEGTLTLPSGRSMNWREIRSIYWRSYEGVMPPIQSSKEQAEVAYHDSRSLWESFLHLCPTKWVNGISGYQLHKCKPWALARVSALALPPTLKIPETLVGNSQDASRHFVDRAGGSFIFKPVQGGAHTRRISPDHLTEENLARLALSPVTFQEEIKGRDIRVFVAGTRVIACELRTGCLDFRDDEDPEIVPVSLPKEIAMACRSIAKTLKLHWAGIDLRHSPDGAYFYFEANPSPMFLGFEHRTGLPLTEALVDLLV